MWRDGAPVGWLRLHDVGAEPGEQPPAVLGRLVGELDHADPVEGAVTAPSAAGAVRSRHDSAPSAASAAISSPLIPSTSPSTASLSSPRHGGPRCKRAPGVRGRRRHAEGDALEGERVHLGVAEHGVVPAGRQLRVALEPVGGVLHDAGRAHPSPGAGP